MKIHILAAAVACVLLVGCASPNTTVFVTATAIGIGADSTTGTADVGYNRHEVVIGPAYPASGGVPPVYAHLESDLAFFKPHIRQLYATGQAAELATASSGVGIPETLSGESRPMVFGTSTSFGLKVRYTGTVSSAIHLGYKRQEYSVLPIEPVANGQTRLGSVIGGIELRVNGGGNQTTLPLTQFMATGNAATNIAQTDFARGLFAADKQQALSAASGVAAVDVAVQIDAGPLCALQFKRGADATLEAKLRAAESDMGGSMAAFCFNPDQTQIAAWKEALARQKIIP